MSSFFTTQFIALDEWMKHAFVSNHQQLSLALSSLLLSCPLLPKPLVSLPNVKLRVKSTSNAAASAHVMMSGKDGTAPLRVKHLVKTRISCVQITPRNNVGTN